MIGERRLALAVRRDRLQARADQQRVAIEGTVARLQGPIGRVDQALDSVRWLRAHPGVLVVALVAFTALRPRGVLKLVGGSLRLLTAWRALRAPQTRIAWALLPRVLDYYRLWKRRAR